MEFNEEELGKAIESAGRGSTVDYDKRSHITKALSMALFIAIDIGLNSVLDYDKFNDRLTELGMATRLLLGLVGVQVVVEISIFLVLFLAMTDTFLFRVGLLGVLVKKFRMVLILHPIYITLTLVTGIYRVHYLAQGNMLYELWLTDSFIFLSSLHKIVAVPYYLLNIRSVVKLGGDPIYFNPVAWIELIRKNRIKR